MASSKSEVPAVTPKSVKREELVRGQKADTGGDFYDRATGNYSKNAPVREDDPYAPFDNY